MLIDLPVGWLAWISSNFHGFHLGVFRFYANLLAFISVLDVEEHLSATRVLLSQCRSVSCIHTGL